MTAVDSALHDHLELLFGAGIELSPLAGATLPVHIGQAYTLVAAEILGRPVCFALLNSDEDRPPKRLAADHRGLRHACEEPTVVLVLRRLTSTRRRRLVEERIPFVVPGRQLFVPGLGLDLTERRDPPPPPPVRRLEWAAQVTLLRHLLHDDVEGRSLRALGRLLGYSAMTLTNVQRQLAAADLVQVISRGRARTLAFAAAPRDLWDAARPRLRSPVLRVAHVLAERMPPTALAAGTHALATRTDLADDPIPTVALPRPRFEALRESGTLTPVEEPEEADLHIELWHYDPAVLTSDSVVDPLSLHLSLAPSPDARIQQALEQLRERLPW